MLYYQLGFGFLTFETEESVDQVCQLHYVILDGKKVILYINSFSIMLLRVIVT